VDAGDGSSSVAREGEFLMKDRAFIRTTLVELLEADTGETYRDLQDTDNLREGLGLDSVDVVSVVSQVERKFHIRLSQEELQQLVTVGDVLDLLEVKLNTPPQSSAA
jgi:acyl carrier protein